MDCWDSLPSFAHPNLRSDIFPAILSVIFSEPSVPIVVQILPDLSYNPPEQNKESHHKSNQEKDLEALILFRLQRVRFQEIQIQLDLVEQF
jgi:hypothetical protein